MTQTATNTEINHAYALELQAIASTFPNRPTVSGRQNKIQCYSLQNKGIRPEKNESVGLLGISGSFRVVAKRGKAA